MKTEAISFAALVGNRLSPGTLCLVVRAGGRELGAIIQRDQCESGFSSGAAQAALIARSTRNPKVFEQKLLKHVARRLKANDPADYEALGALATWLLMNSGEWPFLQPHAEAGAAVLVSLEPQRNGSLRLFFELWENRV